MKPQVRPDFSCKYELTVNLSTPPVFSVSQRPLSFTSVYASFSLFCFTKVFPAFFVSSFPSRRRSLQPHSERPHVSALSPLDCDNIIQCPEALQYRKIRSLQGVLTISLARHVCHTSNAIHGLVRPKVARAPSIYRGNTAITHVDSSAYVKCVRPVADPTERLPTGSGSTASIRATIARTDATTLLRSVSDITSHTPSIHWVTQHDVSAASASATGHSCHAAGEASDAAATDPDDESTNTTDESIPAISTSLLTTTTATPPEAVVHSNRPIRTLWIQTLFQLQPQRPAGRPANRQSQAFLRRHTLRARRTLLSLNRDVVCQNAALPQPLGRQQPRHAPQRALPRRRALHNVCICRRPAGRRCR